jgi:hypothetical protein
VQNAPTHLHSIVTHRVLLLLLRRVFSHIRSTAEFLPKLQSFIAEFVSNKNFVGTRWTATLSREAVTTLTLLLPCTVVHVRHVHAIGVRTEKPLDSYSPDLKNELYYKKYLIFPANGTRLVLKKKKEVPPTSLEWRQTRHGRRASSPCARLVQDEVETAEAGIVFSNLSFFGKKGEDIKSISTFNEFLLGALVFASERTAHIKQTC